MNSKQKKRAIIVSPVALETMLAAMAEIIPAKVLVIFELAMIVMIATIAVMAPAIAVAVIITAATASDK